MLSHSDAETQDLGARLGSRLRGGEVLALVGDLGSGKTTFTRGLGRGLRIADTSLVCSPTYVLEQVYPGNVPIHHYDAYRLASSLEFLDLGFEERRKQGHVLVIEWAEKVRDVLPEETLWIELLPAGTEGAANQRRLQISGPMTVWGPRLAGVFQDSKSP